MKKIYKLFKKKSLSFKERENFIEIIFVLFISFTWETVEHYLETVSSSFITNWFAWVEFWANRIIFDGLFVLLWYFFIKKYTTFIKFARYFSLIWIIIHIFIFPNSMYLHQIFSFEIPYIWWNKSTSCLDFWTIEHFFTWMWIWYFVINFCKPFRWLKII